MIFFVLSQLSLCIFAEIGDLRVKLQKCVFDFFPEKRGLWSSMCSRCLSVFCSICERLGWIKHLPVQRRHRIWSTDWKARQEKFWYLFEHCTTILLQWPHLLCLWYQCNLLKLSVTIVWSCLGRALHMERHLRTFGGKIQQGSSKNLYQLNSNIHLWTVCVKDEDSKDRITTTWTGKNTPFLISILSSFLKSPRQSWSIRSSVIYHCFFEKIRRLEVNLKWKWINFKVKSHWQSHWNRTKSTQHSQFGNEADFSGKFLKTFEHSFNRSKQIKQSNNCLGGTIWVNSQYITNIL